MFGTKLGASADTAMDLYLRPETAQGIFVNFLECSKNWAYENSIWYCSNRKSFP